MSDDETRVVLTQLIADVAGLHTKTDAVLSKLDGFCNSMLEQGQEVSRLSDRVTALESRPPCTCGDNGGMRLGK